MSEPEPAPETSAIAGESLRVRYDPRLPAVLDGVTLYIPSGRITALVGPNGSGKSTLLKTLARQLSPEAGRVEMNGRDLRSLPARELARSLGILFQEHVAPGDLTVEELVRHGRYPHSGWFSSPTPEDAEAVEEALRLTGMEALRQRPVGQLSGGQRQLAWVAMALAQQPRLLFLDEPTTFLDLAHQFELMDLLQHLKRTTGMTLVVVLHDLNLAARYADHLVVLREGRIVAEGPPAELLTPDLLRSVFEIEARLLRDDAGWLHCLPMGKARDHE